MQSEQQELNDVVDAESVKRFLTSNPEFFNQYSDVLSKLSIPHHTGKAVSLIEKQVSVLRVKCGTLEDNLRNLIDVARENEHLHQRLHRLIQDIISASSLNDVMGLTRDNLLSNFSADDVQVMLIAPDDKVDNEIADYTMVPNDHQGIKHFDQLFKQGETICGTPTSEQLELIFAGSRDNVASAAAIPLVHKRKLGVVMLTSKDEFRFASGKGVMFLNQLGEVLSRRVDTLM